MENSNLTLAQWDKLFCAIAATSSLKTIRKAIEETGSAPTRSRCLQKLSSLLEIMLQKFSGTVEIDIVDFPLAVCLPLLEENSPPFLALVMAEDHLEGEFLVHLITKRNAEGICSAIASRVKPGTIVRTSCWSIFKLLNEKGLEVEVIHPIVPRMYDAMVTVMPLFPTCQNGLAKFVQWLGDDWTNLPLKTMQLYLPFFNFHSAMNFENPEKAYDFLLKAAFTTHKARLQQNG